MAELERCAECGHQRDQHASSFTGTHCDVRGCGCGAFTLEPDEELEPPQLYEVPDPPADACVAELCERPRWAGQPFCDTHLLALDVELAAAIDAAKPSTPAHYDAVWRATCELARLEGQSYRRTLFDGTTIDSGH